jgi:membrane protein DedA with SNARE-associated domain
VTFLTLLAATFVSEDLACISAGLLIREGRIGFAAGVGACAAGILLGDLGLWAAGRYARRTAGRVAWVARWVGRLPLEDTRGWLEMHAAGAMLASRFMPGTRLPLYVCAGVAGMSFRAFAGWAAVAVLLWTPALVWFSTGAGDLVLDPVTRIGVPAPAAQAGLAVGLFLLLKGLRPLAARFRGAPGRSGPSAWFPRLARWSRWEFWPMWLFYAPVAVWILLLAIRHRGVATITASNPGIPDGGVVGESKFQIPSKLPPASTIPAALLAPEPTSVRVTQLLSLMAERGWAFPVVLKPDVGQRGVGVRLVRNADDVRQYCAADPGAIIAQPYHPGPFEAGIFYYRFPWQTRGRIFSITDKHFPVVTGDGSSTLEALIWAHPRYRLQASTFLARHHASLGRVLPAGGRLQLAIAGNHAQGTLFRDGRHLWTPELERRVDAIAQSYPGFFVGRFDVRYSDPVAFRGGEDLAIVELNGATAESTDIYDPDRSLLGAYRTLFHQWSIVFAIGAANRQAGAAVTPHRRLFELVRLHLRSAPAFSLSD